MKLTNHFNVYKHCISVAYLYFEVLVVGFFSIRCIRIFQSIGHGIFSIRCIRIFQSIGHEFFLSFFFV